MTIKTQKDKDVEFQSDSSNIPLIDILQFKIVYWGPGESGKTTNYFRLREKFDGVKYSISGWLQADSEEIKRKRSDDRFAR